MCRRTNSGSNLYDPSLDHVSSSGWWPDLGRATTRWRTRDPTTDRTNCCRCSCDDTSAPHGGTMIAPDVALGADVVIHHPQLVNLYGCRIGDATRIGTFVEIQ